MKDMVQRTGDMQAAREMNIERVEPISESKLISRKSTCIDIEDAF